MFKNYLLTALRNIKRYTGYSLINIVGLALGIACCILVLFWINDELSFDRFHENADDIYRVISEVRSTGDKITHEARVPNAAGPALKERYPEVVNFTRFRGGFTG